MRILVVLFALVYTVWPIDLLPDFIVGLGWIDDLAVWGMVLHYLLTGSRGSAARRQYAGRYRHSAGGRQPPPAGEAPAGEAPAGGRDPYTVLGVDRNASAAEIRQAYRRLAAQYHPDKVAHLGPEFQELAERRFKEIQEAYQTLTRS